MTAISPHFTIEELTHSSTGFPNYAPPEAVSSLRILCSAILEPLRELTGPIRITSGYRSADVNRQIGGSKTSQHLFGEAADFQPLTCSLGAAWTYLVQMTNDRFPVDQAIVYVRQQHAGWIHVSLCPRRTPRRELLVELGGGRPMVRWADYNGPVVLPP